MKRIICKIDPWIMNQTVYIFDDQKKIYEETMPLDDLINFIVSKDIKDVYIGGYKNYVCKVEKETKAIEKAKYGKSNKKFHYLGETE